MPDEPEPSFEQALTQIERIVVNLERGEPDLTTALANYEKGVRMLTHCYRLLDQAEQSAALLIGVDEQGNPITAPFDATATIDRETSSGGSAAAKAPPRDSTRQTPEPKSRHERHVESDRTEASELPF
jgi:exodeoxyribonuclease VII small subunit